MGMFDQLPGGVHSLFVSEALPKFDVKRMVVAITHSAEPCHYEAAFFIDVFFRNAGHLTFILSLFSCVTK
jgi:hypothetical protein